MKPWFYDKFRCTAENCSDNCCIGWEIDIDSDSMERFRSIPGEFGERLRGVIRPGDPPTFALAAGDRCALLREDGLCELVLRCGEDSLCDICALHPRFFNEFGEVREEGLGLCCEEVCRLLFSRGSRGEPLEFLLTDEDRKAIAAEDGEISIFRKVRSEMFGILQNRSRPITERLSVCAEYGWSVQEWLEAGENSGVLPEIPKDWLDLTEPDEISRLFEVFSGMEDINEEWTELFRRLSDNKERLTAALPEYLSYLSASGEEWRYEHTAVYFLYRHYTGCVSDGAVYARTMLAVCSALMVMLMDCLVWLDKGEITEWDMILNLKLYSKQAEYSQENIDAFIDEYC